MIELNALIDRLRAKAITHPDLNCDPDADIEWAESLSAPRSGDEFALELIFVICNSGMRFTTARGIFERVTNALGAGKSARTAFGHSGKCSAIDAIWTDRNRLHKCYIECEDGLKLDWLESLPWIGGITKYHAAKNFGLPVCKPDVHLQRLADTFDITPQQLCEAVARRYGYSVPTVDTLLWRGAACGVLDTSTGRIIQ